MNSFSPNYFIHAANVLLLVAYSVRDILWLRLFAVGASRPHRNRSTNRNSNVLCRPIMAVAWGWCPNWIKIDLC